MIVYNTTMPLMCSNVLHLLVVHTCMHYKILYTSACRYTYKLSCILFFLFLSIPFCLLCSSLVILYQAHSFLLFPVSSFALRPPFSTVLHCKSTTEREILWISPSVVVGISQRPMHFNSPTSSPGRKQTRANTHVAILVNISNRFVIETLRNQRYLIIANCGL